MDGKADVVLRAEVYEKLVSEITRMSLMCSDMVVRISLNELLYFITSKGNDRNDIDIEKTILKKLEETKYNNPDLNVTLYILLQDYKRGKISHEEVVELLQRVIGDNRWL